MVMAMMGMGMAMMVGMMMGKGMDSDKKSMKKFGMMKNSDESNLHKHKSHKWWTRNDDSSLLSIIALTIAFPIVSLSAWIWMVTMILK